MYSSPTHQPQSVTTILDLAPGGTTHTYTAAGTYTVDLTVTNAGGSNTTTRHNYVTVLDPMHIGLGDAGAAAKGEVTQASLTISNASSLVGGSLNLTYDPAVVTVDAVRSSFTTFVPDIENEKGRTRIVFRDGPGQNGDVDICTVTLNATGEPGEISPLKITVTELVNTDHQDITFAALPVPGEFQVLYPNAHNPSRYRDASNGNLYKGIQSGNTLYFGEEGLNLTRLGSVQRLVHYSDFPAGIVDDVIVVPDSHFFDLKPWENPATGCYYAWGDGGSPAADRGLRSASRRPDWMFS